MVTPILAVSDIDASIAFYTEMLGFTLDMHLLGEAGAPAFAIVKLSDDTRLGLEVIAHTEQRGVGVELMLTLTDDTDIAAYYADVQAKQVPITQELKVAYWGQQLFSVRDLDGYELTLCQDSDPVSEQDMRESRATL
jgi:catechol 2,3-dioxygenase-like lactoylglutathione lyase family enzyme